jgi:hypothetical protein
VDNVAESLESSKYFDNEEETEDPALEGDFTNDYLGDNSRRSRTKSSSQTP